MTIWGLVTIQAWMECWRLSWVSSSGTKHVRVTNSMVRKFHVDLEMAQWLTSCCRGMENRVRPWEPT